MVELLHLFTSRMSYLILSPIQRGEEQDREEGEMAQTKLGGGRNRGGGKVGRREKKKSKRLGRREKLAQKVGRSEIYPPVPPLLNSAPRTVSARNFIGHTSLESDEL